MVTIDVTYQGDLRTQAVHGPSDTALETDAPTDNHGLGARFSPTDLLATSLATCMMTIMGIEARRRGADLTGASARVTKHMVADPHRRIGRLDVAIRLPSALSAVDRAALEAAGRGCPVCRSLSPAITLDIAFG